MFAFDKILLRLIFLPIKLIFYNEASLFVLTKIKTHNLKFPENFISLMVISRQSFKYLNCEYQDQIVFVFLWNYIYALLFLLMFWPTVVREELCTQMGFLFSQFWPIAVIILESCE